MWQASFQIFNSLPEDLGLALATVKPSPALVKTSIWVMVSMSSQPSEQMSRIFFDSIERMAMKCNLLKFLKMIYYKFYLRLIF